MRGRGAGSALANPVLVGAVTVLVTIVAVFLAYNANQGLPFVPTQQLKVLTPSAAKLVEGNEVREGGYRIGVVDRIRTHKLPDGTTGAELRLKLDKAATPVPADSTVTIRPRSVLGLKYIEFQRGDAADTLFDGDTIRIGEEALAPELEEFFNIFDEETRENVQANLEGYGNGFAFRGKALNLAFQELPTFFRDLVPVMRTLAEDDTRLARFFAELGDAARISAPLAETIADGFAAAADTFEAIGRDPEALKATIEKSPGTLAVGERSLRNQRPFLRNLALMAADLRGAAAELRVSAPVIAGALRSGIEPLQATPALNRRLGTTFENVTALARRPSTDRALAGLSDTMRTLNPSLRYLGPHVTVCNYWNYWWTYLADHLTDEGPTGNIQRVQGKEASPASEQGPLAEFGQSEPVPELHAQSYGAAVDEQGNADCESGQRGYMEQYARGVEDDKRLVLNPDTPGLQGPTFSGRPSVPAGQTFSHEPESGPEIRP